MTVIWVSVWSKWVYLFKILSLMSQSSTNKRTFSVFGFFQFAVFNDCWSTTLSFSFNYYTKQWHKYQTITLIPSLSLNYKKFSFIACDVMLKHPYKSTLWKTRNYYNDNKKQFRCDCLWCHAEASSQNYTLKNT